MIIEVISIGALRALEQKERRNWHSGTFWASRNRCLPFTRIKASTSR
jgi:hypothetical protein